jgi:hypothetical protein
MRPVLAKIFAPSAERMKSAKSAAAYGCAALRLMPARLPTEPGVGLGKLIATGHFFSYFNCATL